MSVFTHSPKYISQLYKRINRLALSVRNKSNTEEQPNNSIEINLKMDFT